MSSYCSRAIATMIDGRLPCPVCQATIQTIMRLLSEDKCPEQDILTCPHCGLELYITTVKGKR